MNSRGARAQSSFELLLMLSLGLAILIPVVIIAFIQLSNASSSVASIEAQQAASKLSSIATLVGTQGPPAKEIVQIQVPNNVQNIYIGNTTNGVGHEIIFIIRTGAGPSYVTQVTQVNVSGDISSLVASGTYLVNVSAQASCPSDPLLPCVYISPAV